METVAIVGVGLIGGSFGLALKKAGFGGAVLGVSSESSIGAALERGAIDRGAAEADADLFSGRTYVLTPGSPEELETPAAREFVEWVRRIGAKPVILGAAEHDRLVSFTSHLPQLASTALAATIAENLTSPGDLQVAGPGLI